MHLSVCAPTATHKHTFRDRGTDSEREREFSRTNGEAEPEPSRGQFLKHRGRERSGPWHRRSAEMPGCPAWQQRRAEDDTVALVPLCSAAWRLWRQTRLGRSHPSAGRKSWQQSAPGAFLHIFSRFLEQTLSIDHCQLFEGSQFFFFLRFLAESASSVYVSLPLLLNASLGTRQIFYFFGGVAAAEREHTGLCKPQQKRREEAGQGNPSHHEDNSSFSSRRSLSLAANRIRFLRAPPTFSFYASSTTRCVSAAAFPLKVGFSSLISRFKRDSLILKMLCVSRGQLMSDA